MLRWIGWGLAVVLGLPVLILGAAYGLAQTDFGQRWIATVIEDRLSSPDRHVTVRGLGGWLPFDVQLAAVTVADPDGVWLELAGARIAWSPGQLFAGRLHVDEISAASVVVHRPPADGEPEPATGELPRLPETVLPVIVERLAVERIDLGEPVLGQPAAFTLQGRMAAAEDLAAVTVDLALERVDEPTAWVTLDAELVRAPRTLTLNVEAEETGDLLASITGRPEAGDFRLALTGTGPADSWLGQLTMVADNLARVDADVALALVDEPRLAAEGRVVPHAELVPAGLADLLGDALGFDLAVTQTAAQRLAFEEIHLVTDLARVDGQAVVDLAAQSVEARAAARIDDLAPLSDLAATPLAGSLVLGVSAEGALAQPTVELDLRAQDIATAAAAAGRVAASLRLVPLDPDAPTWTGLRVTGDGEFEDLTLTEAPPLPERDLRWEIAAVVPAEGPIEVERLTAAGDTLQLAAAGAFDPVTRAGRAELRVEADDLAPLAALAGETVEGAGTLTADVTVLEAVEGVTLVLDGRFVRLAGLPPAALALFGPEIAVSAVADVRPDEWLRVSDLRVAGAAATLTGDVDLGLNADPALVGDLTLTLPRLDVLEPVIGEPIQGEAVVGAALGGTVAAPEAQLSIAGNELVYAGQSLDALTAEIGVLGLPGAPYGPLSLVAERAGQVVTADATYRLEDQTLALADLSLTAPATRVSGALTAQLDALLVDGQLSGTVDDLAALGPLLAAPDVSGSATFETTLRAANGVQAVDLTAEAADLAGGFGRLAALSLRAEVADVLGEPGIEASAELQGFRSAETALERASVQVAGGLDVLDVTVQAAGEQRTVGFDLGGGARISHDDGALVIRLSRLDGSVAGEAVSLLRPATFTVTQATTQVRNLELQLATARLRAEVSYGPETVALQAGVEALPLGLLAAFGVPDLTGTADARLTLAGPLADPAGTLTVDASDVRVDDPVFEQLRPGALSLRAELEQRRLGAELSVTGLTDGPITARIGVPVVLALDPFSFDLPEDGALSGRLNAELQLARLEEYLDLGDQSIAGLLRADLELGGTVGDPAVAGEVTLADGSYEHGLTGTLLRNIGMQAVGTERQIVVRALSADDGAGGRVTGSGVVNVDAAQLFPFELTVNFDQTALLRREFADGAVSGDLRLAGNLQEALAAGALTVTRLNVSLVTAPGLHPTIPVIDVVEIGVGGPTVALVEPEPADGAPPMTVGLDITVDVPARAFVRGRGLESEWGGRLRVRGTVDDPQIVGTLTLRRGHLDFLGQRLALREGAVEFTGESPPLPQINVTAAAETPELTALIRLTGPVTNPEIRLDSEPSLPPDEILSRLLFGQSFAQLGPTQAVRLAAALNTLREPGPGLLGGIRDLLGVDVLDIGAAENGAAPTIRAGRYLTGDVFLQVERDLAEDETRATVEVEILPDVTLEAEVREDRQLGVGLQWRFDY